MFTNISTCGCMLHHTIAVYKVSAPYLSRYLYKCILTLVVGVLQSVKHCTDGLVTVTKYDGHT